METKDVLCPRCKITYFNKDKKKYPATSRRDNKTEICSGCGTQEALFDFTMQKERETEKAWLNEVKDVTCKRCDGSGFNPNEIGYDGEPDKEPCSDCDGTGLMEIKNGN